MAAPTEKQLDYALQLANKLTGERARYASQSSIDLKAKTAPEATALIDQLKDAIEEHAKWQQESGLAVGAKVRRHYVKQDGTRVIASGEVTGYEWGRNLVVCALRFAPDEAAYEAGSFSRDKRVKLAIERLGDDAAADPVAELEAEREKLLARLAEVDAQLAALRG
jgi:hypothetical protein